MSNESLQKLTRAEEQIMRVIWSLGQVFVKEIIAELPEPRPPYNTVSSVVRILEQKKFLSHKAFGKTHQYFPVISKNEYRRFAFNHLVKDYFEGSYSNMLSFFAREENLPSDDIRKLLEQIESEDKS